MKKTKLLVTIILASAFTMFKFNSVFADVDKYVIKDKVSNELNQYSKKELMQSFRSYKRGEKSLLYIEFANKVENNDIYMIHDDSGKYIAYEDVMKVFLEKRRKSEEFDIDEYCRSVKGCENPEYVYERLVENKNIVNNLNITGNNLEKDFKNYKLKDCNSIKVTGKNVSISNIDMKGTSIIISSDGNIFLNNIKVNNIKVLSGKNTSIHFNDVEAEKLRTEGKNKVNIEVKGNTQISNTEIYTSALINAVSGNCGEINVVPKNENKQVQVIELKGKFTEPIIVEKGLMLKAFKGADIKKIEILPKSKNEEIKLDGYFKQVEIKKEAKIKLEKNSKINRLEVNANIDLYGDKSAIISRIIGEKSIKIETSKCEFKVPTLQQNSTSSSTSYSGGSSSGSSGGHSHSSGSQNNTSNDKDQDKVIKNINLDNVNVDLEGGKLTNTTLNMQYSLNSTNGKDGMWNDCKDGSTNVEFKLGKVYVHQKDKKDNIRIVKEIKMPKAEIKVDEKEKKYVIANFKSNNPIKKVDLNMRDIWMDRLVIENNYGNWNLKVNVIYKHKNEEIICSKVGNEKLKEFIDNKFNKYKKEIEYILREGYSIYNYSIDDNERLIFIKFISNNEFEVADIKEGYYSSDIEYLNFIANECVSYSLIDILDNKIDMHKKEVHRKGEFLRRDTYNTGGTNLRFSFRPERHFSDSSISDLGYLEIYEKDHSGEKVPYVKADGKYKKTDGNWIGVAIDLPDGINEKINSLLVISDGNQLYKDIKLTEEEIISGQFWYYFKIGDDQKDWNHIIINWNDELRSEEIDIKTHNLSYEDRAEPVLQSVKVYDSNRDNGLGKDDILSIQFNEYLDSQSKGKINEELKKYGLMAVDESEYDEICYGKISNSEIIVKLNNNSKINLNGYILLPKEIVYDSDNNSLEEDLTINIPSNFTKPDVHVNISRITSYGAKLGFDANEYGKIYHIMQPKEITPPTVEDILSQNDRYELKGIGYLYKDIGWPTFLYGGCLQHLKDYAVYYMLENKYGAISNVNEAYFTTKEMPMLEWEYVNQYHDSANISICMNLHGKLYYAVLPSEDNNLSKEQIKNGIDVSGNEIKVKGQYEIDGMYEPDNPYVLSIKGLKPNTKYKLYILGEDKSGNEMQIEREFRTLDLPIVFEDPDFEKAIREIIGKLSGDIYSYMLGNICDLDLSGKSIENINPLKSFKNLCRLNLKDNTIKDISALKEKTELETLDLSNNYISDITPLEELDNLHEISLSHNSIKDVSPLKELEDLSKIYLNDNNINDISILKELTFLENLHLENNNITNIDVLKEFEDLEELNLKNNNIKDISALNSLNNLKKLWLKGNKIIDYTPIASLYEQLEEKDFEIYKVDLNVSDGKDEIEEANVIIQKQGLEEINVSKASYEDGNVVFYLEDGEYSYTVIKEGYDAVQGKIIVKSGEVTEKVLLNKNKIEESEIKLIAKEEVLEDGNINLTVKSNEKGAVFYVVLESGSKSPTAENIKQGLDAEGKVTTGSSITINQPDTKESEKIKCLKTNGTSYDIYLVAEDKSTNLQSKVIVLEGIIPKKEE